ncbi:MAG: TerB family tellurite resistance protein, partial [Cyclobacteriaceae bacterium]|nr:TerB family tellurite resistance protein [Cyclobacteriaceae bacterium]
SPSKDKSVEKSHIKNLIAVAKADGDFSEIEEHLLVEIAQRIGLSSEDVQEIKNDLDVIQFVLPERYDQRIEQFQDLLALVSIDGFIDDVEIKMCRKIAEKYELPNQVVTAMLSTYT